MRAAHVMQRGEWQPGSRLLPGSTARLDQYPGSSGMSGFGLWKLRTALGDHLPAGTHRRHPDSQSPVKRGTLRRCLRSGAVQLPDYPGLARPDRRPGGGRDRSGISDSDSSLNPRANRAHIRYAPVIGNLSTVGATTVENVINRTWLPPWR